MAARALRFLVSRRGTSLEAAQGLDPLEVADRLPARLGLYAHIPFCERICRFCPYNRTLYEPVLAARYVRALTREVELLRPHLESTTVTSLYVGGGTPTLVPEALEMLADTAARCGLNGEMAVEVLPLHATGPRLRNLRDWGVDYVSIGVQSFDDAVLAHLGRSHNAREGAAAMHNALEAGFDCVDVDLVFDPITFGLDGVVEDATRVFRAGAHQLSVYPMMRFLYTPVGPGRYHDEAAEKRALDHIARTGERFGYRRSSVWTFNRRPDTRYTSITREFYLGLGPSGSSFLDGLFLINTFDTASYAEQLERNLLPVALRTEMKPREMMGYYLFWRAYEGAIDRNRFRELFGSPIERALPGLMLLAVTLGLVRPTPTAYALTSRGLDLFHSIERWVTYNFIEPTWDACRTTPFPNGLRY